MCCQPAQKLRGGALVAEVGKGCEVTELQECWAHGVLPLLHELRMHHGQLFPVLPYVAAAVLRPGRGVVTIRLVGIGLDVVRVLIAALITALGELHLVMNGLILAAWHLLWSSE